MCNCPRCTAARRLSEERDDDIERANESTETPRNFWPHFVILRPLNEEKTEKR